MDPNKIEMPAVDIDKGKTEKIIARIRQMRAMASSTHSRAEAETMLSLAAKLIAQNQLSEAELELVEGKTAEEICTDQNADYNIVYETGRSTPWKAELAWGLAKLNGLYCLKYNRRGQDSHRQGSCYRVFGRKSDIEICKFMFDAMVATIVELAEAEVGGGVKRGVNPVRESWCLGCVRGFLAKMNKEKEEVMAMATSSAMVLVGNRVDEAKQALFSDNPRMRVGSVVSSKATRVADTYSAGFRKGGTLTATRGLK